MQKQIGDKVTIQIARPECWTKPFPEHFNARPGVVERIREGGSYNTYHWGGRAYLVRFAKPVQIKGHPYYERSNPYTHFWFDETDLNG